MLEFKLKILVLLMRIIGLNVRLYFWEVGNWLAGEGVDFW
jgi:hypothetical protein